MERQPDVDVEEANDADSAHSSESTETGQETSIKSDKGALWLLVSVVALAATTLWLIRDIWIAKPVVVQSETPVNEATAASAQEQHLPAKQTSASRVEAAQDQFDTLRRQKEESLLAAKKQAAENEKQRLEAEQLLKEERAARAALEAQQMEAEKQLAEERAALEQARLVAEKQLETERLAREQARLAAEEKLASERAERAALERRATVEKRKMREIQLQVERAERERVLANEALQAEQARLEEAVSYAPTVTPEQISAETMQNSTEEMRIDTAAVGETDAVESEDRMDSRFSSNPCDGPSAKFLSTCR